MKWNEYTWYSKWASLLFFILVLPILTFYIGTQYQEAKLAEVNVSPYVTVATSTNVRGVDKSSSAKKFRLYRKFDDHVYLVGSENIAVYYKSNEVDKFKEYQELDYLEITADSYTKLSSVEETPVGIKDYSVEITQLINGIGNIKKITEDEFSVTTPYIGSISPSPASKGATIEIRGSGFNGFEGDVYFSFKRSDGKSVRLAGVLSTQVNGDAAGAQTARVVLKEPCQEGQTVYGEYSGIPAKCDYVELTPGIYTVGTRPWSINSNEVTLTIK